MLGGRDDHGGHVVDVTGGLLERIQLLIAAVGLHLQTAQQRVSDRRVNVMGEAFDGPLYFAYLGGGDQLRSAGGDLVGGGDELLVLAAFIDNPVSRVSDSRGDREELSLRLEERTKGINSRLHRHLQQLRGAPAHSLRSRDQPLAPARILGVKLRDRGCPLQEGHIEISHLAVASAPF